MLDRRTVKRVYTEGASFFLVYVESTFLGGFCATNHGM